MSLQFFFFLSGLAIQLSDTAAAEMLLRFFEVCNPLALASHVAGCITGMHHRQPLNLLLPLPLGCVRRGGGAYEYRGHQPALSLSIFLWNMADVSLNLKVGWQPVRLWFFWSCPPKCQDLQAHEQSHNTSTGHLNSSPQACPPTALPCRAISRPLLHGLFKASNTSNTLSFYNTLDWNLPGSLLTRYITFS